MFLLSLFNMVHLAFRERVKLPRVPIPKSASETRDAAQKPGAGARDTAQQHQLWSEGKLPSAAVEQTGVTAIQAPDKPEGQPQPAAITPVLPVSRPRGWLCGMVSGGTSVGMERSGRLLTSHCHKLTKVTLWHSSGVLLGSANFAWGVGSLAGGFFGNCGKMLWEVLGLSQDLAGSWGSLPSCCLGFKQSGHYGSFAHLAVGLCYAAIQHSNWICLLSLLLPVATW